jgi:hypothetical protein
VFLKEKINGALVGPRDVDFTKIQDHQGLNGVGDASVPRTVFGLAGIEGSQMLTPSLLEVRCGFPQYRSPDMDGAGSPTIAEKRKRVKL